MRMFKCEATCSVSSLANINRVDIMNVDERDANYCIDDMQLTLNEQPEAGGVRKQIYIKMNEQGVCSDTHHVSCCCHSNCRSNGVIR